MDPLLRWLAIDGYGFHEGYFDWPRSVEQQLRPTYLSPAAAQVFDQGLGRSLWFVAGADAARLIDLVTAFPSARQADLWSGVGLACTYAGGADRGQIALLHAAAGMFQPCLAQGAAFAAAARRRAGNLVSNTELACEVLCGTPAVAAAAVTDRALEDLAPDGADPAYTIWRQRIQAHFAEDPDSAQKRKDTQGVKQNLRISV